MFETIIDSLSKTFTFILNLLNTIFGFVDAVEEETDDGLESPNITGGIWDIFK